MGTIEAPPAALLSPPPPPPPSAAAALADGVGEPAEAEAEDDAVAAGVPDAGAAALADALASVADAVALSVADGVDELDDVPVAGDDGVGGAVADDELLDEMLELAPLVTLAVLVPVPVGVAEPLSELVGVADGGAAQARSTTKPGCGAPIHAVRFSCA